jgi:hypothetical protein
MASTWRRHAVRQPRGQLRFADLAVQRAGPVRLLGARVLPVHHVDQVVLDVLLGDRGSALHAAPDTVPQQGPQQPLRVDGRLVEEPAVLDGHDGGVHRLGDLVEPDR